MASSKKLTTKNPAPAHVRLSAGQRREQLIDVAVDLFSRRGFKGTTTREIALAAGVTEAIIFRHFATKEHLYTAIIDQKLNSPETARWVAELQSKMRGNDDEAVVRHLIRVIILTHKNDPRFERLMLYAALEGNEIALLYMRQVTASIVDVFRSYFVRRQKLGKIRPINADVALTAIAGMAKQFALGKYVHEFKEECLFPDEQAVESLTAIAMHGIALPEPQTALPKARKR